MPEPVPAWRDVELAEPSDHQMWLLGVSEQDLAYRDALMQLTSHMIGTALRTPYRAGYYERLNNPLVGEMVMEYTRGWWSSDIRIRALSFGVLVAVREEVGIEGPVSYVRWGRNGNDVERWANSKFVLVPIERDTFGP